MKSILKFHKKVRDDRKLTGSFYIKPSLNSVLHFESVTAESSERGSELRGAGEHLKVSRAEFIACKFYSFWLHAKANFIERISLSLFC